MSDAAPRNLGTLQSVRASAPPAGAALFRSPAAKTTTTTTSPSTTSATATTTPLSDVSNPARSAGPVLLPQRSKGGLLLPRSSAGIQPKSASEPAFLRAPIPRRRTEVGKGHTDIPAGFAEEIEKAISIDLAYNRLDSFPAILSKAGALEELSLAGNFVADFPKQCLEGLRSLITLKLDLNPVAVVPAAVFTSLPLLRELYLRRCGITAFPIPADCNLGSLRTLALDDNDIVALPEEIALISGLKTLSLSSNRLKGLPQSLSRIETLTDLRLRNNAVTSLPSLPSVTHLDASSNRIESLPEQWFAAGAKHPIRTLLLQSNRIAALPASLFASLRSLETLDISENGLTALPAVVSGESLSALFVGGNRIERVELGALPSLRYLDVSRNALKELPGNLAEYNLKMLSAGYNPLSGPPKALPGTVVELHLSGCGLKSLPECELGSLVTVFLAGNKFSHRSDLQLTAKSVQSLKFLDVSYNNLSHLPSHVKSAKALGVEVQDACCGSDVDTLHHSRGKFTAGTSSMTGRRPDMEDVTSISLDVLGDSSFDMVSVYDGHGGDDIAKAASVFVLEHLKVELGKSKEDPLGCLRESIAGAAREASLLAAQRLHGSTALVGLFESYDGRPRVLHMANVGDARAVMRVDGRTQRISVDHKPLIPEERSRIIASGGWVTVEGRVMDTLAIARALGDTQLQPKVSSEPFVCSFDLSSKVDFVIFACDGVWDVVTDEVACNVVANALERTASATLAAMELRDWAFLAGSNDNISVVVATVSSKYKRRHKGGHSGHNSRKCTPSDAVLSTPEQLPVDHDKNVRSL